MPSGTSQSASRTYAIAGQKTVRVMAQNDQGASSDWTTHSFNCGNCPIGYVVKSGACIFSACPSGYVLQGTQCIQSNACTAPNYCQGRNLVDGCTDDILQVCEWGCAAGRCNDIPKPAATLKAIPSLVKSGKTTTVSWTSQNATSCAISGTNGDNWTKLSSTGETTRPITSQTFFTLTCQGYAGAIPSSVTRKVEVNIAPTFEER